MKRKIRNTFKRRPQPGVNPKGNLAYHAHQSFDAWKLRYGAHPPITRANRSRHP